MLTAEHCFEVWSRIYPNTKTCSFLRKLLQRKKYFEFVWAIMSLRVDKSKTEGWKMHWKLFNTRGFCCLIFLFLHLASCFKTIVGLGSNTLMPYLNLCWKKLYKSIFVKTFLWLNIFFKGLIYSEFKTAERASQVNGA